MKQNAFQLQQWTCRSFQTCSSSVRDFCLEVRKQPSVMRHSKLASGKGSRDVRNSALIYPGLCAVTVIGTNWKKKFPKMAWHVWIFCELCSRSRYKCNGRWDRVIYEEAFTNHHHFLGKYCPESFFWLQFMILMLCFIWSWGIYTLLPGFGWCLPQALKEFQRVSWCKVIRVWLRGCREMCRRSSSLEGSVVCSESLVCLKPGRTLQ